MTERKVNCVALKPFYLGAEVKTNLSAPFELSETEFKLRQARGEVEPAPKSAKPKPTEPKSTEPKATLTGESHETA